MDTVENKTEKMKFLSDNGLQPSSLITVRISDLLNQLSVLTRNKNVSGEMEKNIMKILDECSNTDEETSTIRMSAVEFLEMYDFTNKNDKQRVTSILSRNCVELGITARIDIYNSDMDEIGILLGNDFYPFCREETYSIGRGGRDQ